MWTLYVSGMRCVTEKLPLSFVVASSVVPFAVFVNVTFAPATAFPCGSVTVPTRFPYTACPRVVLAPNPSARQRTSIHPTIACFFIRPLLGTPDLRNSVQPYATERSNLPLSSGWLNSYGPCVKLTFTQLSAFQNENGINGNLPNRPVRSEQPPNSSTFSGPPASPNYSAPSVLQCLHAASCG